MKMNVKDTWFKRITMFAMFLLAFLSLLPADQVQSKNNNLRLLEKSLIFPGLGQLKAKKTLKGLTFIAAELCCITYAVINNSSGNDSYNLYLQAITPEDVIKHRLATEKYDSRRNLAILAGITVWIINLIDIYIFVKKQKNKNISLKLKNDQKGNICLNFVMSF